MVNKAAQKLGRMARGGPKKYSQEEIEKRRRQIAEINKRRRKHYRVVDADAGRKVGTSHTSLREANAARAGLTREARKGSKRPIPRYVVEEVK